jgi:hypothetical protein
MRKFTQNKNTQYQPSPDPTVASMQEATVHSADRQRSIVLKGAAALLAAGVIGAGAADVEGHVDEAAAIGNGTVAVVLVGKEISERRHRRILSEVQKAGEPYEVTTQQLEPFRSRPEHQ